MNSWNLSIPLTTAAEVSVIFFAAHARGYLLLFYLTVLCVGLRGGQRFITAKAHFSMFGMAHIDLFGLGRSLSELLH